MLKFETDSLALRKTCARSSPRRLEQNKPRSLYQIDNRLSLLVNLQLASTIPLAYKLAVCNRCIVTRRAPGWVPSS